MPVTVPTLFDRLRTLRQAVTEGHYRAIQPECHGKPMTEVSRCCDPEDGDSFEFECDHCARRTVVELPVRLAHAGILLRGAA